MWNGLDIAFSFSFFVYLGCIVAGKAETGHAILACAAVLLFPRYVEKLILINSNLSIKACF